MLRHIKISLLLIVIVVCLADSPDAYPHLAGDLNEDYVVDWKDLRIFAWQWLDPGCLVPGCVADLDGAYGVNMGDFALLANNWKMTEPHLVISEFMAKTCNPPILDGNGEASDWIEIYNPTDKVISLDGWYLTNDKDDPTMWQFPSGLGIENGKFLIVFASEKTYEDYPYNYPYLDASGRYHTNFKLDESEGYLALVAPDSDTIIHEYPQYPKQLTDVSYGLAQYATTLVPTGATASYHVPDSNDAALGAGWTATDFNDSTWDTGTTGLGFGSSVSGEVATNVGGDMMGINASLWARIEFNLEEGETDFYNVLALRMKHEDGFAAYLNNHRVSGRNEPASLTWNSTAISNRPIENALVFEEINLAAYLDFLQDGKNVLAIQGLNDDKYNDHFLILPELIAARHTYVPQYFTSPTPETFNISGLYGIVEEVWFSHERGFYYSPFQLILSNGTDGAEIRYTLDGSQPTISNGYTYTSPIDVNETTTIRAVAVKAGLLDSKVETHTYIFLDDVVTQSPNGDPPPDWPTGPINGQILDYGMDPSVVNHPYYASLVDDALLAIPAISLVTDLDNLFDPLIGIYVNAMNEGEAWERPTSVELINPEGSEGFQIDAGLQIRGQFDRADSNPKHSFRLYFVCEYGQEKLKFPLFGDEGVNEFESIDLRTAQAYSWSFFGDARNTMLREVFSRDLQDQMGHPYTRSRYYHLYINGQYWGIYQTQEHCTASYAESYLGDDEDDDDYDDDDDDDYEASGYDEGDYDIVKSDWSLGGRIVSVEGDRSALDRLYGEAIAGFDDYERYYRVQGLNIDGTTVYEKLLDIDNLIDFMIIEYYTGDKDGPGSRLLGKPNNTWGIYNRINPDGFKWLQHESEHSLGTGEFNMVTPFTTAGAQIEYFNPHWLHEQLAIQNAEYRLHFADHVHRHFFNDGLLTYGESRNRIETRANQIDMAIIAESARWGDANVEPPLTKDVDWLQEINRILYAPDARHLVYRVEAVLNQFVSVGWYPDVDAPVFYINGSYQHGGEISTDDELTIDNPSESGTIYYTLDGSDPRQYLTGNPVGTPYTGPITLNKSTNVKARVLDGTTWSALNEAIFAVGPIAENLRITEIMFHPRYMGNINDPNKEYIELKNIGPNTLNINLVKFTEGIHFTFPDVNLASGEHIVVVKDLCTFEAQYGTSVDIAGQYTGELPDDAGVRIRLEDAIGRTILDFEYRDRWYPITDGDGFSLTIIDPTDSALYGGDQGLVAHWKFDNGSGSTATDSAGTNHGTLNGDPNWINGRIGGALSFDGEGDYVAVAPIAALAGDSFTAQAWIRLNEFAEMWNPILTQHDPNFNGYYLFVSGGKPAFYIVGDGGASFIQVISYEYLNADLWYHVAATNDGTNLKLYVNGLLKDIEPSSGLTGVSDLAYIGSEPVTPLYYHGLIDDVRIYNRPVSKSEFQNIDEPMRRWSRKDSWRPSVYRNGSPGWDDSGRLPNPGDIVINEVMVGEERDDDDDDDFAEQYDLTGISWVELHNTTDKTIDIGGWFLSSEVDMDDFDNEYEVDEPNLMKYRIADGTTIPGNDYIVFYQDTDFNNPGDPGCLVPFIVSGDEGRNTGGAVWLSSRMDPNGYLTGYREIQIFGVAQWMVSFGRYYKSSTDTFDFVAMDYNTPDSNNAPPKVGPVVINEIMYNPPTGYQNEEYIELHNITAAPYTLYRFDEFTPWKLTEGVEFTFSSSPPVTILPHGYLLVVKDEAAFTARYGSMPPGVQVLGDYDGRLSNDSGIVELSMPGDYVDWDSSRVYIRIDRIDYSDGFHPKDCPGGVDLWPREADGLGKSLCRKDPNDYGNDVANWKAATPSPGTANP